jgi:protein-S-isoprenylcysteine O-methyltransferase Ste14
MKLLSLLGVVFMAGGSAGLFFTDSLFSLSLAVIIVQVAAFFLMVWARITFGIRSFHATANTTKGGLVTSGPYSFVRHPIYAAVCYFVIAGGLAHISLLTVAFVLVVLSGAGTRMLIEERFLRKQYPEYGAYETRVKRVVPYLF